MNLWKYYNGNLKYPNVTMYSLEYEIAKTTPKWAYLYVKRNGKNKDLEPTIAKDATYSYRYADEILNGPFKLGEKAIAKNTKESYYYALQLKKGGFEVVADNFINTITTIRNTKGTVVIDEQGLFELTFNSSKPVASKFKDYMFGTVLPHLQKYGTYTKGMEHLNDTQKEEVSMVSADLVNKLTEENIDKELQKLGYQKIFTVDYDEYDNYDFNDDYGSNHKGNHEEID
jgi:prophage antirepressor-like protein